MINCKATDLEVTCSQLSWTWPQVHRQAHQISYVIIYRHFYWSIQPWHYWTRVHYQLLYSFCNRQSWSPEWQWLEATCQLEDSSKSKAESVGKINFLRKIFTAAWWSPLRASVLGCIICCSQLALPPPNCGSQLPPPIQLRCCSRPRSQGCSGPGPPRMALSLF